MKESRFENILHARRKTETQKFDPMGDFTTQDAVSLGITNRGQAQFLRSTIWGLNRIEKLCNRSRFK